MHFTLTRNERFYGAELCCDLCNRLPKMHPRMLGNRWYYVRYDPKDMFPSLWICPECKEDLDETN